MLLKVLCNSLEDIVYLIDQKDVEIEALSNSLDNLKKELKFKEEISSQKERELNNSIEGLKKKINAL